MLRKRRYWIEQEREVLKLLTVQKWPRIVSSDGYST